MSAFLKIKLPTLSVYHGSVEKNKIDSKAFWYSRDDESVDTEVSLESSNLSLLADMLLKPNLGYESLLYI